jgi:hypothetical protein
MSEGAGAEATPARRVRRNPWIMALAALPFLANIFFIVSAISTGQAGLLFPCIHATFLGLAFTNAAYHRNPWPRFEPARVRANAQGLALEPGAFLSRRSIKEAFVVPQAGKPPHVLVRKTGISLPIELEVDNEQDGRRILRGLGLDASQTVARFRTMSRAVAHQRKAVFGFVGFGMLMALLGGMGGAMHLPGLHLLFPLLLIPFVALSAAPTRLEVGADGLFIRWLFWKRFIPHADVHSCVEYDEGWGRSRYKGLMLVLESGETVRLPISQSRWDNGKVAMIHERIREAAGVWREGGATADTSVLAKAKDHTILDWVRHLRALGAGTLATHRVAAVVPETLWRIVEDPSMRAKERAAAAVALSGSLDEEAKGRLRVAAQATAEPKLRVALEAVADGKDDEDVVHALQEMESDA